MVQAADFPSITEAAVLSHNLRELLSYRQKQMEAEMVGGGIKARREGGHKERQRLPKYYVQKPLVSLKGF